MYATMSAILEPAADYLVKSISFAPITLCCIQEMYKTKRDLISWS